MARSGSLSWTRNDLQIFVGYAFAYMVALPLENSQGPHDTHNLFSSISLPVAVRGGDQHLAGCRRKFVIAKTEHVLLCIQITQKSAF